MLSKEILKYVQLPQPAYFFPQLHEAQRLRQLEDENHRLKKLVADLSLDKDMLKAVISKNGWGS